MNVDKAGEAYWSQAWQNHAPNPPRDPHIPGPRNYAMRRFHRFFTRLFSGMNAAGKKFLEIGCARSVWLPYFAKAFGFKIYGLDYSEIGCRQAREILAQEGLRGEIVFGDLFAPPAELLKKFDLVWSYGVVEHFSDTAGCLKALAQFLKPKGTAITLIPNMKGAIGFLQKTLHRPIYDIHVPLSPDELRLAHEPAGLRVSWCGHFLSTSFGIVNVNTGAPPTAKTRRQDFLIRNLSRFSKLIWALETYTVPLPATTLFSPYIICVAIKEE